MKKWLRLIISIITFALLIIAGYLRFVISLPWADWTGFETKTLWEWMNLLIIPAVLAFVVFLFNYIQSNYELKIAEERANNDRNIALNNLREQTWKDYIEKMTQLLLEKNLRKSEPGSEVRNVAHVQTLTAIRTLDKEHKVLLLHFLYESNLIVGENPIIIMGGTDFEGVNLSEVDFSNINLSGVNLKNADFECAILNDGNFSKANLDGAILTNAKFKRANLSYAQINYSKMAEAIFCNANLDHASIQGTFAWSSVFTDANLEYSILIESNLSEVTFTGAYLNNARLYESNLEGAILTKEQAESAHLSNKDKNRFDLN